MGAGDLRASPEPQPLQPRASVPTLDGLLGSWHWDLPLHSPQPLSHARKGLGSCSPCLSVRADSHPHDPVRPVTSARTRAESSFSVSYALTGALTEAWQTCPRLSQDSATLPA